MTTPVYATRITSLSDARYFSGMGVQWLGIQTNPNTPGYLSAEQFKQIAGWVTGPQFMLEVDTLGQNFDPVSISQEYGIDRFCISAEQRNVAGMFQYGLKLSQQADWLDTSAALFTILESAHQLEALPDVNATIFLPAPASVEEAREILKKYPSIGFIVKGSPEEAVGLKEYESMDLLEFLDELG